MAPYRNPAPRGGRRDLERALSDKERHKLGAHYTPRAYVERLIRPTVEEPLRAEWDVVRAHVHQLIEAGKSKDARAAVHAFHQKLTSTRVLDPACGSGNFLYVTLDLFKRLEAEVLALLRDLGETQQLLDTALVRPSQFLGIEVKRWAKEIAELVLWIGYLQWYYRTHGRLRPPPEPVLQNYRNIECRDAVLAWDRQELVRDDNGKPATRWDGETTKKSPVTGEDIPDDVARVPIYRYVNPRKAEWPKADFIVGNPPFVGNKRMRLVLGDAYAEALRQAHPDVPESADFVMYWWNKAAHLVAEGHVHQAGLITTNSITQSFNRRVLQNHLSKIHLAFAIQDHPWVDSIDGAAVRISMTTVAPGQGIGKLAILEGRNEGVSIAGIRSGTIGPDLRVSANVVGCKRLLANSRICGQGVKVVGDGFYADADLDPQAHSPLTGAPIIRRIVNPQDILRGRPGRYVIDFFGMTEAEAREVSVHAYQQVQVRVKPLRDQNKRASIRDLWWRFAWERPVLRAAKQGRNALSGSRQKRCVEWAQRRSRACPRPCA